MVSVELFSGAGGLALGLAKAGFEHLAVVEWDEHACATLNENKDRVGEMRNWPIFQADVRKFDYSWLPEGIDLLAGGVPCQPFSIGGKHRGHADERNMFPELIECVRLLKPKAVLVENVRGLARHSFAKYFGYIELMLIHPELTRRASEAWMEHLSRLEQHHTRGKYLGLHYRVVHRVLNAANYGIPQKRERLFMVAIRADLPAEWSFPSPTHSAQVLELQQDRSGEYWERHHIARPRAARGHDVLNQADGLELPLDGDCRLEPWRTVRDAFQNPMPLPSPAKTRNAREYALTHFSIPGARSYVGHTGSPLDEPAKTLKAGVHGVPGGENMLLKRDGTVRYFTIRESARLQTFPEEFTFTGSWTESMRQIGNAVPVSLAELLGRRLKATLERSARSHGASAIQSA
jgi:DNA (cytosine-5)-methyltransferase 1